MESVVVAVGDLIPQVQSVRCATDIILSVSRPTVKFKEHWNSSVVSVVRIIHLAENNVPFRLLMYSRSCGNIASWLEIMHAFRSQDFRTVV